MEQLILEVIGQNQERMIADILSLVRIKSVETTEIFEAPFGPGVKAALLAALRIGRDLGFETVNLDNHIGYVQYGEGDDYVCAIGHLDVVPEGEGWTHPPYSGFMEDGRIYSRGILDNKGPLMACLYGLYAIKAAGCKLKRPVRIIFGCDEESGFLDLRHYLSVEKPPVYGFTPDCKYPVVYSERGRALIRVKSDIQSLTAFFQQINTYFLGGNAAAALGLGHHYQEYGVLEAGNYKLLREEDEVFFEVAFRYPPDVTPEIIMDRLRAKGMEPGMVSNYPPVVFDKEGPLVSTLRCCYEEITGLPGQPVTTTGGTYAKILPNIVPFGPSFPGQKGIGHNPDEWMSVDDLMTNCRIYGLSLYRLAML